MLKYFRFGKGKDMKKRKWMKKSVSMAIAMIMALQIPGTVFAKDTDQQAELSSGTVESKGLPQSDGNKLRLWYTTRDQRVPGQIPGWSLETEKQVVSYLDK